MFREKFQFPLRITTIHFIAELSSKEIFVSLKMDFLSSVNDRNELLSVSFSFKISSTSPFLLSTSFQILNTSIDRIYKKESSKKYMKHSAELDYISNIFTQYCSNQLTKVELLEYFPVADHLKDTVFKAIEVRKPQICQHLVNLHNRSQFPLMKSFDWDLKFIVGNSSLATFREQRATLMLNCQRGSEEETLSVELNRSMLEKLMNELEKSQN